MLLGAAAVIVLAPSLSYVVLGTLRDGAPLWSVVSDLPRYLSDTFLHLDLGYDGVPWVVLAIPLAAMCFRMARSSPLEVLGADHIRTARAKGVREKVVLRRHALRAALPPVIGLVSVSIALMVTNVILVETAFALPGFFRQADVGQFLGEQGHLPDPEVVQALILEAAALISVTMLIADLLHARLDPRVRALH